MQPKYLIASRNYYHFENNINEIYIYTNECVCLSMCLKLYNLYNSADWVENLAVRVFRPWKCDF